MTDLPCEAQVKVEGLLSISTPACVLPHLDSPTVTVTGSGEAVTSPVSAIINWRECHERYADKCRYDRDGDPECCYPVYDPKGKISHYEWSEVLYEPWWSR